MYQNRRLDLRLSDRDLIVLDAKRGNISRSRYLRWLIHYAVIEDPMKPIEPTSTPPPFDRPTPTEGF